MRLCVPIYELPRTGDPVNDAQRPYVILYSAETVGLPGLYLAGEGETASESGYISVSSPVSASTADSHGEVTTLLIPTFPCLVQSEMHVLLRHADYLSSAWCQHVGQLSELLRPPSCEGGYGSLPELVNPELVEFARWIKAHLQGETDCEKLRQLKEVYACSQVQGDSDEVEGEEVEALV